MNVTDNTLNSQRRPLGVILREKNWLPDGVWTPVARSSTLLALLVMVLGSTLTIGVRSAVAAEVATFEIVARDGRLYPERLEVPAGVKLKLTLRNEGKTPVEFENLELRIEKVLSPDAATSVTVQALKPGSHTVIDDFHAATGKMLLIAK